MAFSVGGGETGSGRRRFGASTTALAEINIVPLVDVVLVLLIIFMLTAHVMEFGMDIEVPKIKETPDKSPEDLAVIQISKSGQISLNDKKININQIPETLKRDFKNPKKVYVRADARGTVDSLVQVIAVLGKAGISPQIMTKGLE